jgi:ATP-dependent exoDNAse (exonuclease V) alpha subunit
VHPHLDHRHAVTSHSSQGQTADRVLIHMDTTQGGQKLVNRRLAYVAVSRGRYDAQIYTNDKTIKPVLPKGLAAMFHTDLRWSRRAQRNHGSPKGPSRPLPRVRRESEQSNETSAPVARCTLIYRRV